LFGGQNQSILATSFTSGVVGGDELRIYMPDRRGAANGVTNGTVDSNFMQGLYAAQGTSPNVLIGTYGTMLNGSGYLDPEGDSEVPSTLYPTLRGSTLATSGTGGDMLGDELLATEFTMTRDSRGLPVLPTGGAFTPQGSFPTVAHPYGTGYMIYYASTASVVIPPTIGGGGGGTSGGGFIPDPIDFPETGPFTNSPQQADRYTRSDELVDNSVFSFESWRDGGGGSGDGYWVVKEPGLSSVILPEDRPGGMDGVIMRSRDSLSGYLI